MPKATSRRNTRSPLFTRRNYVLLIAGVLAVVVGYAIMRIDNQLDGFTSLYVAPLIILGGYLEVIYAILWRPADDEASSG
jgi:NADH:ubiquinone oxidoreductase subunit 4 (subunit M)